MKNRTDLNLGEVVYVSIIYHIPDSSVNLLNGYDFYFWLRDSANREYSSVCLEWKEIYNLPFKVLNDTKSREFQYS